MLCGSEAVTNKMALALQDCAVVKVKVNVLFKSNFIGGKTLTWNIILK